MAGSLVQTRFCTAAAIAIISVAAAPLISTFALAADKSLERGRAPGDLVVTEQKVARPVTTERALPLCQWPAWPKYKQGDPKKAESFACAR